MAKAVRRKYRVTLPDGSKQLRESEKWYAEYRDANGERQRVPGYTDKAATEQKAAALERAAAQEREGVLPANHRQRRRPLAEHLAEYLAVLESRGDVKPHVELTGARVRAVLAGCGFTTFDQVDGPRVQRWLAELRRPGPRPEVPAGVTEFTFDQAAAVLGRAPAAVRTAVARHRLATTGTGKARRLPRATVEALADRAAPGASPGTVNGYVRAVKGFFGWLHREGRFPSNPLALLRLVNDKVDVRRGRRELRAEELTRLLGATRASARAYRGLTGEDRFHLYLTAATTGFRAAALAALTPADFDLDPAAPVVTLPARFNKSRRTKVQPVRPDVAEVLRAYLAGKPAGQPVWGGTWAKDKRAATMLRIDLDAAGIPYAVDGPDGPLYADFHALRHSFLTLGSRSGIDLRTLQELAGHSEPGVTARYAHVRLRDMTGAVEKMPSILPPPPPPAATGTDGPPRS